MGNKIALYVQTWPKNHWTRLVLLIILCKVGFCQPVFVSEKPHAPGTGDNPTLQRIISRRRRVPVFADKNQPAKQSKTDFFQRLPHK